MVEARVLSSDGNGYCQCILYTQTKQPRQCSKPQILPFGAGTGPMQLTAAFSKSYAGSTGYCEGARDEELNPGCVNLHEII